MRNFKKFISFENYSLKKTLGIIKKNGSRCSVVVNKSYYLVGTLSDGDIRKKILKGKFNLRQNTKSICHKKPKYLIENSYNTTTVKKLFTKQKYDIIPIVDKNRILKNILIKDKILKSKRKKNKKIKSIKAIVVIMAGGFGSRMDPITKVIPKPLVPIKNQTIIEHITNKFFVNGFKKFYFSVGYKKNLIKAYFEDQIKKYKINYLSENKPLGTAGGLKALQGKISNSFFVTNCDSIFNINYKKLYSYHLKNNFDITIVVSKRKFSVPYGVCDIKKNKKLIKIDEKPEFNFNVMTGMYILKPKILSLIPSKKFFNMDQLIKKSITKSLSVGCYAVSRSSWIDVGQLREYKKNVKNLS